MKTNRVKSLNPLIKTKFLSLYDTEYENKKGMKKHWALASRKDFNTLKEKFFENKEQPIDAVIIAALHKESNKLILIRQFRVPLNDYIYELPAGLIDKDETIECAARRELKEETGLTLAKINKEKSVNRLYVSPGMTDESLAMVYCTCEGTVSNKFLEDDEDIQTILVSQEDAKKILKENANMDIKAWMALQSFAILGEDIF